MKIRDILIRDILLGKNWRFNPPNSDDWLTLPMEEWGPIEETSAFQPENTIIYSGLIVYPNDIVIPIVCLKEVQDADIGGDYCEFIEDHWCQVGLNPNPDKEVGCEFIANPLESDPSFDSLNNDFREYNRKGFQQYASKLQSGF